MSIKSKVSMWALGCCLTLVATPALAVSYDSQHHANRYNEAGVTTNVMVLHWNHFCYLSKVGIEETDTKGEYAMCRVRRSGAVWLLEAILGKSSNADAYCSAICYNNT